MDPGEQTTGTRDEHYDLIAVLYHALHSAENCDIYAADAEAAGEDELAAFFREAQDAQTQLAERAKGLLGIGGATPAEAGSVPAGGAMVGTDVPTGGATAGSGIPPDAPTEEIPLTTNMPRTPPGTTFPPPAPPSAVPLPDEDLIAETGGVVPDAPSEGEDVATPAEAPRRRVPPDAPRTEEPPPRTGDAPPSPSEQLPR